MAAFALKHVSPPAAPNAQQAETFSSLMQGRAAVCFKGFMNKAEVDAAVAGVYKAEHDWSVGFGGLQYALGDAWYHYAEEGIPFEEYTKEAARSREIVDQYIPGLERKVLDFLSQFTGGGRVEVRAGWAGPGVTIFPAHNYVAQNGGSIHFDTDAFSDEELQSPDLEMYSFVCMLQKPVSGGDLYIWDEAFDREACDREQEFDPEENPHVARSHVEYLPGDLWMFNGMRAHRIESFGGDTDRICITFHITRQNGHWLLWF